MKIADMVKQIFYAKAVEAREIPERVLNEEIEKLLRENQPFLYASGNFGPGYVTIKSLVAFETIIQQLVEELAHRVLKKLVSLDFVAGNVTGGLIPGWILSEKLAALLKREVYYIYVGGTRKESEDKTPFTMVNKGQLEKVARELKQRMASLPKGLPLSFVAGVTPGGMVLGYRLSQLLTLPFVYVREARKKGGQQELITGKQHLIPGSTGIVVGQVNNPMQSSDAGCGALIAEGFQAFNLAGLMINGDAELMDKIGKIESPYGAANFIPKGQTGIVVEELVNFAQTSTNSALLLRQACYRIETAATILYYDNPKANEVLAANGMEMIYLLTLSNVLDEAPEAGCSVKAVNDWRNFLKDPLGWQEKRGLKPVVKGGTL